MNEQPIIVKKVKKAAHAHHGGAWKIAYADFVTAMMAFFLLMWLINMTSPEQKKGLADYFAPANVSRSNSGAGGLMGGQAFDPEGARMDGSTPRVVEGAVPPQAPYHVDSGEGVGAGEESKGADVHEGLGPESAELRDDKMISNKASAAEDASFQQIQAEIRQAIQDVPELADLERNVVIDQTPEGLRIQVVDQEGRSMFPPGHPEPYERTKRLMGEIAGVLSKVPNRLSIAGHTDSSVSDVQNGYTNWDLSSDRANSSRRLLQEHGIMTDRIFQVAGKADSEPLFPDDPLMPANRRISIVLLREAPVLPPGHRP